MPYVRKPILARLISERRGNVSIVFALSAVPMILLMGAAVDYTRTVTKRTSLQQATDATVLAVAHDLSLSLPLATVTSDAQRYFAAAVDDANAWIYSGPTISPDNSQVCLTARTSLPTMIMSVAAGAGMTATRQTTVVANACARINNTTYEIALALDNSGSMNESTSGTTKIASLKDATQQLIAIMDPAGATPRAAFSLVPFSSAVNVGAGYANAAWMDTGGRSSIHWQNFQIPAASYNVWLPTSKFDLYTAMGASWKGCVEERPLPYMTSDAPSSPSTPDTLFVPYLWPDESKSNGLMPLNNYFSSEGNYCSSTYVNADTPGNSIKVTNTVANDLRGDTQTEVCKYRQALPNVNSMYSDVSGNPLKAGPNLLCSSQPLTTLTNDTTALNASVATMTPNGDTNLISGFMWAWRTISTNGPFGGIAATAVGNQNPKGYTAKGNQKVIVLMTDGFNHWSSVNSAVNKGVYSSFGYFANGRLGSTTTSSNYRTLMDNQTLAGCTNAKAAGIKIYTIGFTIPSDPIDTTGLSLLQSCASDPTMAYIAQDGNALVAAFKQIGSGLSGLRLVN